jgi:hypothetical protein
MGIITNIIQTLFTTSGADGAAGAADRVGRSQTRLGNASASAGRQFAAQASGMGGLVGAYAGAAATIIALTSAYSALTKAAEAQQTLVGLNALAAGSATSGEKLLETVQKITKGQLAMAEAAGNINLALSAGFSGKQIEGLSSVALKASRALGRDLTDSMTRVVRGSAKMEAELLDELGIYTKIGPATRAYAASLGVSVTSLTEFQRRQAFANAVIAEGERKFASISTVVPTTSEKLQAFGATVSNITTQITMFIADALAPLASFLTDNLGASFGAVGLAATLVFSKALSLLQAQIKVFGDGVNAYAARLSNRILAAGALTTQKLGAARTAVAGISGNVKGTAGIGNDLADLKKTAGERNLNTQELAKANTVLNKRVDNLKTLRTGEMAQVAALKAQRAALTAGTAAYIANEKAIAGMYKRIQASNKLLTSTRAELAAVTAAANTSAVGFARLGSAAVRAGGAAIIAVARLATGMISLASKAIGIVAIFGIVGSAIANAMGKGDEFNALIKKLGSAIKGVFTSSERTNAKNVFQGTTAAILTSMETTDAALKNIDSFKFKTKYLGVSIDVEKTKQQLVSDVSTIMSDLATGNKMGLGDAILTQRTAVSAAGGALGGALAGGLIGSFVPIIGTAIGAGVGATAGFITAGLAGAYSNVGNPKYDPDDDKLNAMREKFASQLGAYDQPIQDQLAVALSYFQDQYGELAKMDPVVRSMLDTYSQMVIENGKYMNDVFGISDMMKSLGKDAATVTKNFTFDTDSVTGLYSAVTAIGEEKITFKNFDIDTDAVRKVLDYSFVDLNAFKAKIIPKITTDVAQRDLNRFLSAVQNDIDNLGMEPGKAVATELASGNYGGIIEIIGSMDDLKKILATTDIGSPFRQAHGSISASQNDLALVTQLLNETRQGVDNNSISFDQYTQNIANSTAGIIESTQKLADARRDLATAEDRATITRGSPMEQQALALLGNERKRVIEIEKGLEAAKRVLAVLKEQGAEFEKRLELESYLESITTKQVSGVELGAKVAAAGSGNDLQTQIQYAYATVAANKDAISSYDDLSKTLNTLPINDVQKTQALMATTTEDLAKALNSAGVKANIMADGSIAAYNTVDKTTTSVKNLSVEQIRAADTGNKAMTALSGLMQTLAVDTAKFMHDKLTDYKKLVTDAEQTIRQIEAKQIIVKAKFELDMQNIKDQMAASAEQFKLDMLNLDINLIEAKKDNKAIKPLDAATQVNAKQQDILRQQKEILVQQYVRDTQASTRADGILQLEAANAQAEITAKTKLVTDQIDADTKFITASIELYNAYLIQQQSLDNIFVSSYVAANNGFIAQLVSVLSTGAASFATVIRTKGVETGGLITGGADLLVPPIDVVGTALADMAILVTAAAVDTKNKLEEAAKAQKTAIEEELQNNLTLSKEKRALLVQQYVQDFKLLNAKGAIETENAKKRITEAEKEGKALDKLQNRTKEMFDSFKGSFESAFSSLYNLATTGEGTVREIIGSLFKSIAEEVYKQTIATPLSNVLAGWVTGAITKIQPTDILGSKLQGVVGSAANATGDALLKNTMGDAAVDKGGAAIAQLGVTVSTSTASAVASINAAASRLGAALGTLGTSVGGSAQTAGAQAQAGGAAGAAAITGSGTALAGATQTSTGTVALANTTGATTLMASLGPILAVLAVIAAIMAIFGGKKGGASKSNSAAEERARALAQSNTNTLGSVPQMASGGMMRDRVPALLEPGEFVIRKPIARKIGASNLAAMNATGNTGSNSAPTINIKNEGSPKNAEASPPRFDGERYVIDIIMRDLSTNGPIRRTLRGGAL